MSETVTDLQDTILRHLLPLVPFDGWTEQAIASAARAAGLDDAAARRAFPGGPVEAIVRFAAWADERTIETLAASDIASMRVRDRITLAVRTRLELLAPYKDAVRRSTARLAQSGAAPDSARIVYRTVDAIWRAAGDTSTDYNFYTKRGLLAGVVVATTAYWLNDRSPEQESTWRFLDRRIDEVMRVGKKLAGVKGTLEKLADRLPLRAFRTRRA